MKITLSYLRRQIWAIASKPIHSTSDIIELQLINLQLSMLLASETIEPGKVEEFKLFLRKAFSRVSHSE